MVYIRLLVFNVSPLNLSAEKEVVAANNKIVNIIDRINNIIFFVSATKMKL
jgi:hypothetical protein